MASIVLIEDDAKIRQILAERLAERGHDVTTARVGLAGLEIVIKDSPDVVVLDMGLPDVDGSEVLKMIRAVSAVPVIIATARDDETEIVSALDQGADDYVVKPFSADQIEARIRAVLRRSSSASRARAIIEIGDLVIEPEGREARLDGVRIELTRKEFDLLAYLARRPGTVVTKRELLAEIWRQPYGGADKTVDVHLSWLRRKLGESAKQPRYLHTVRGVGVKLVDPEA
jgi:DNA-binding response OmpR family regulator